MRLVTSPNKSLRLFAQAIVSPAPGRETPYCWQSIISKVLDKTQSERGSRVAANRKPPLKDIEVEAAHRFRRWLSVPKGEVSVQHAGRSQEACFDKRFRIRIPKQRNDAHSCARRSSRAHQLLHESLALLSHQIVPEYILDQKTLCICPIRNLHDVSGQDSLSFPSGVACHDGVGTMRTLPFSLFPTPDPSQRNFFAGSTSFLHEVFNEC